MEFSHNFGANDIILSIEIHIGYHIFNNNYLLFILIKSMTNWSSCISNKFFLKKVLFLQFARIKRICNNSDNLMLATRNLIDAANSNGVPPNLLVANFNSLL